MQTAFLAYTQYLHTYSYITPISSILSGHPEGFQKRVNAIFYHTDEMLSLGFHKKCQFMYLLLTKSV